MAIKTDVKRLMSTGLTGWQAGLLVFEDSWKSSYGKSFLTEKDISYLYSSLRTQKDIQDYNTLIRLYRTADYLSRQTISAIFSVAVILERISGRGFMLLATYMARTALKSLPLPVTEKELESLKASQRKSLLHKYYCLEEVISLRAYAQASEELKEEADDCITKDNAPELYQQAEAEIQALIEAGKLKPVKLDVLASSEEVRSGERRDIEWWTGDYDWTPEETERKLQTYIQGSQLYKRGLPEWREEIDTFKPYLLDKEHWLAGFEPPYSVAIVQEPYESDLDKRGFFKKDFMSHWPLSPLGFDDIDISEMQSCSSREIKLAIQGLKKVLARRQVLKELGQVIGLATDEMVDFIIEQELKPSLSRYNLFASEIPSELERLSRGERLSEEDKAKAFEQIKTVEHTVGNMMAMDSEIKLKLPTICLDKIKLPAKELAEVRGWISVELGDEWWNNAGQTNKRPKPMLSEILNKSNAEELEVEDES
jgi:hypothetical protein